MRLHDEIMNIPCEPIEGTESEVLAFKLGHKQARHAAAELAARFSEWQNEASAVLAHFVSLSNRPDDRRIDCRSVPEITEEEMKNSYGALKEAGVIQAEARSAAIEECAKAIEERSNEVEWQNTYRGKVSQIGVFVANILREEATRMRAMK